MARNDENGVLKGRQSVNERPLFHAHFTVLCGAIRGESFDLLYTKKPGKNLTFSSQLSRVQGKEKKKRCL